MHSVAGLDEKSFGIDWRSLMRESDLVSTNRTYGVTNERHFMLILMRGEGYSMHERAL